MDNRVYEHSEKAVSIWKQAFSLLLVLTLLPALPSIVLGDTQQVQTQFLVSEDYDQEITEPSQHATPSISEWDEEQTTAQITYQDGRVYFDKINSGGYNADMIVPLTTGYADGATPASAGTPATDLYVEFDWQAHNTNTRLYLRGLRADGRGVNLFYFIQSESENKLQYVKGDSSSRVTSAIEMSQTDSHTIRLLMQRTGDTYIIAKAWIDGNFDKDVNLTASASCGGLYCFAVDERRSEGTGLGSSFGSLRIWQPAQVQLQTIMESDPVELSFDQIKGTNTDQNAVTENLILETGQVLSNGLAVVGWQSSDTGVITNEGIVTRPSGEDKSVELTPMLAIRDVIGDGSATFQAVDVAAAGGAITVEVKAQTGGTNPPEEPEEPGDIGTTEFLTLESYDQEITEPSQHATPSISEWDEGETTAQITYQGGRVYFDKLNSGGYNADMIVPLTTGYADGATPASAGTPVTDLYVEFDWQAHNTNTRLYLRGLRADGRGVNLFYFIQSRSENKLEYVKGDNSSRVTSAIEMSQTDSHTIRLLMQRTRDTYTIAKAWIDGNFDKDVNLVASESCGGLYCFTVDERRSEGTGLGSSFGSLRVWQPAQVQLQTIMESDPVELSFDQIKGTNTDQNAVTENLILPTGQTMENGLVLVDWQTSNADVITKTGQVTRPAETDAEVELTPVLAIRDVIGDGSAEFEPVDVTAAGTPITVTVRSMQLEEVKKNLSFEQIKGENIDAEHVESDLVLPSNINGVDLTWEVQSIVPSGTKAEVDVETGSVRRPTQDEQDVEVVLRATLMRNGESDQKDITFTIKKMEVGEEEYLLQLVQRLTFAVIAGENSAESQVRTDLNLIRKFNGAQIVWESSNPAVVSEEGKVNCSFYPQLEEEVVLSAALTLNGVGPVKKEFFITVLQGEAENLIQTAEIKTNIRGASAEILENLRDGNQETTVEVSAQTKEFYITFDLKEEKNISRVDFITHFAQSAEETALKGYGIEVSDNGTTWTEIFSGEAVAGRNEVDFKPVATRYIRLYVSEKETGKVEQLAEVGVRFCPSHQNLVDADAESLEINLPSRITANAITLPTTGKFGSHIQWSFRPDEVFEKTGEGTYKVVHGTADKTVTLIAEFRSGEGTTQVRRTHTVAGSGSGSSGGGSGSGGSGGGGSHSSTGSGSNASNISVPPQSAVQQPDPQPASFWDLEQAKWATEYIEALYQEGIVSGKGDGQFAPLDPVTREEFVKMLVLALDLQPIEQSLEFTDTDNAAWYTPYIACAVQNGLVQGVSETEFGIGTPITREDMAVMSARAIQMYAEEKVIDVQPLTFGDETQIAEYARESVELLVALGLVSGDENGDFCPKDNTSRAEAAKILYMLRSVVR